MSLARRTLFRGSTSPAESPQKELLKQKSFSGSRRFKANAENVHPNTPNGRNSATVARCGGGSSRCATPVRPTATDAPTRCPAPLPRPRLSESDSDSGVTVLVRVRPLNKKELQEQAIAIVSKTSENSLLIADQQYTFDGVASEESSQADMFQLVGVPIVENCIAGFNSSIFAYGQTGSGKTYTMWGNHPREPGLTPRVFETLFARIKEEEAKNVDKQLHYQCRCSFLEIYNEQIADLLDPRRRNLQIREDVKNGVYVDSLTEEYVCTMADVSRLLLKGLANRRVGATSMNTESSRSHTVFTCVLECRFKSMADGSLSSVRRSRINLVDLAGSERQKQSGAAGERLKEASNINRSLSQLGNVINILAEIAQTGRQRHVPYRDSRLTFLLQESLGGNAKLAMICAVSPADSCKSETASTLRFAQRAKAIQNKAVINEETTTDTNLLREQIRQLKDELNRMKSKESQRTGADGAYSNGWNARRSYNLLRLSLALPMTLPTTPESDSDEEMEIDEDAVEAPGGSIREADIDTAQDAVRNEIQDAQDAVSDAKTAIDAGRDMIQDHPVQDELAAEAEVRDSAAQNQDSVHPVQDVDAQAAVEEPVQNQGVEAAVQDAAHPVQDKDGQAEAQEPFEALVYDHPLEDVVQDTAQATYEERFDDTRKRQQKNGVRQSRHGVFAPTRRSKVGKQAADRIAASLQRGLQILEDRASDASFSFKVPDGCPEVPDAWFPNSIGHNQEVEELRGALEVAITGHTRLLEQYAELQEKHVALVAKQRKIREGVSDVRQMGLRAGLTSSQLKWMESQAAQIVALNLEREQEREQAKEEIEFLQSQLQDTADAVRAAGELLVRLKEAEEAAMIANDAAALAEHDVERLWREMEKMKRRHATEMATLQQRLLECRLQRAAPCPMCVMAERVKFEFTEVDTETARADMEAEEDAAALSQQRQMLEEQLQEQEKQENQVGLVKEGVMEDVEDRLDDGDDGGPVFDASPVARTRAAPAPCIEDDDDWDAEDDGMCNVYANGSF